MNHRVRVVGVLAVTLAVRTAAAQQCPGDVSCDQNVTIDEIVTAVNAALNGCPADASCAGRFPASGQTTSYGRGSDGNVRAGTALSYTDNGDGTITDNVTGLMWEKKDGTITDNVTGLMWEKKDGSGGIHDVNNRYTFGTTDPPYTMNGTMVTQFLAALNTNPCFANHCNWRMPNVKELQSIMDYEIPYPGPTVNAAFNTNCVTGCMANGNGGPMCSCTASDPYWSSSTDRHTPAHAAWTVDFFYGPVFMSNKDLFSKVRAVRTAAQQCPGDVNCDQHVTIDEIITVVNAALNGCPADASCAGRFPASGQITSYGGGSDGNVRAGTALSYTDNGDGTITDNVTGLMWEKKDASGGIHDVNNRYTFGTTDPPYTMNGTMVTELLATLNRVPCFANHCDWRIPNVKELLSIVDYEIPYPGPTVNAAFNTNCVAGCTVNGNGGPMCSCTASGPPHWSSSTYRDTPADAAWDVDFFDGAVFGSNKDLFFKVRAVRGGL